MNQAPRCPAGDVCLPPANSSRLPILVVRARAAVQYAARTLGLRAELLETDDLAQELLLRLWQRYPSSWGRYSRRLVNRVALRLVIDAMRYATARKRDIRRTAPLEEAGHVSLFVRDVDEALVAREELRRRLDGCRHALAPEDFRLFLALHVFGLTSRQAAVHFDASPATLDVRSVRLRRRLALSGIRVARRSAGGTT